MTILGQARLDHFATPGMHNNCGLPHLVALKVHEELADRHGKVQVCVDGPASKQNNSSFRGCAKP